MDDLISRQAAIDALNEYFARIGKLKRRGLAKGEKAISLDTVGAIKTLPSAQPEIIRCAECKWFQCNMRQDGYLPEGVDEFECRHWCGYSDPTDFCSYAERRTNG